jgi:hypothetical protein
MNSLSIAPAAQRDPKSIEMIRVQIAEEALHCVIRIGFWEDRDDVDERKAWGMLLADLVRHIADAHKLEYDRETSQSIRVIRESFEAEMAAPTSGRTGEFVSVRGRDA